MSFSSEDQSKYKALYLQTARQYVNELKDNLLQLSSGNATTEVIDSLHRAAHSLRGQSSMMGYQAVTSLSEFMEHIFFAKKENKLTLTDELVKKITEAVEAMAACIDEIEKSNKETDLSAYIKSLQSFTQS